MGYVWALAVLQFHLLRHAVTGGKLVACFIMGCVGTMFVILAGGFGWGLYLLGSGWIVDQPRELVLVALNLLLLIYIFGCIWGLAMEMQRSDLIDVRKMLYFPVPLFIINAINFLISLVGIIPLLYGASMLGLLLGVYSATERGLLAGLVAAGVFFLAVAAWTYCLRGLMTVWMENKRRRRLLMSVLPLFFMVAGFLPMVMNHTLGAGRGGATGLQWLLEPAHFVWVERFSAAVPTGWFALALTRVITGEGAYYGPVAALALLGAAGYLLGYRFTLRYCHPTSSGVLQPRSSARMGNQVPFTARRIPGLSDDIAGLVLATFLSFLRHPQMRTMMVAPLGMLVLLAVANSRSLHSGSPMGIPAIVIIWPFFMFSAFFFNLFGLDTRGFRTIMMLPVPRYRVLLSYHLALLPLVVGMGLVFTLLGAWYFSLGYQTILVCALQVAQLFLVFSLAGSFISIYAPFAMGRNMMRSQHSRSFLMGLLMPFLIALLMLPTSMCLLADHVASQWGMEGVPAGLILSMVLLVITGCAYPFALRQAGDLLLMREQRILATLQKAAE